MTTTVFTGVAAGDGKHTSEGTTYAQARDGTSLNFPSTSTANAAVGQYGDATPIFDCYQVFLSWDTSSLAGHTINSATLQLVLIGDSSDTDFTLEVYKQAWLAGGLTNSDFMTAAELTAASANICANLSTVGIVAGYVTFVDTGPGLAFAVVAGGTTELVVASSRHRSGTQPSGSEWCNFSMAEDSVGSEPLLTVDSTPPAPATDVLKVARSSVRW